MSSSNSADQRGQTTRLVHRLRAGDPAARGGLIDHAQRRFHRLASRMLSTYPGVKRWVETDDVLQSAVARLFRALQSVAVESSAHFHRLAALQIRRELLDLVKRYTGPEGLGGNHHTNGRSPDDPEGPLALAAGGPASPGEWVETLEEVAALPEQEREVVDLLFFDGLSRSEVAALLGVCEKTVGRRLRSARRILGKALGSG
ncbi:MAG TPA: sigma-70 family RNA polymerase sigma factor [Gemmataceae bacterium]|jgi:RNA polymerase sigma-70 factor (ECF subfamily)|nr:sigma-70 family RNA polymerase sigma factor [Gemmataceae bacterium]